MNRTRRVVLAIMACALFLVTACGKGSASFGHGSWDGNTYSSEFLGIKIQLGSDWTADRDDSLAMAAGISDMSESRIQTVFDKGGTIMEMYAVGHGGSSISITVQDNDTAEALSEEEFFSKTVPYLKSDFEASGFEYSVDKGTVRFLGKDTDCINLSYAAYKVQAHEIIIPIFKSHYTAIITFSAGDRSGLSALVGMVTAI